MRACRHLLLGPGAGFTWGHFVTSQRGALFIPVLFRTCTILQRKLESVWLVLWEGGLALGASTNSFPLRGSVQRRLEPCRGERRGGRRRAAEGAHFPGSLEGQEAAWGTGGGLHLRGMSLSGGTAQCQFQSLKEGTLIGQH